MAAFAILTHLMEFSFSNADYLHERLNRRDQALSLDGTDADFFAWKDVLTASGETVFSKRLASLHLDETQARQRTRRTRVNTEPTAPRWFTILEEAFNSPDTPSTTADHPFADIWAPIAAYARTKIEFSDLVSPSVRSKFVDFLHAEICQLAAESTYIAFCEYRARGTSYVDFVDLQRRSQCTDLFSKYPALAR